MVLSFLLFASSYNSKKDEEGSQPAGSRYRGWWRSRIEKSSSLLAPPLGCGPLYLPCVAIFPLFLGWRCVSLVTSTLPLFHQQKEEERSPYLLFPMKKKYKNEASSWRSGKRERREGRGGGRRRATSGPKQMFLSKK